MKKPWKRFLAFDEGHQRILVCLEILIIDTATRFDGHVSGEIPVHLMKTCWLISKPCASVSQGWIAEMLLAAGMMPCIFIWSGDGHLRQHAAVSLAGRM